MLNESSPRSTPDGVGRRAIPRNPFLLALAVIIGASVASVAWTSADATYMAEGNVWIEQPDRRDGSAAPFGGALHGQAWIELLRSYRVLEAVVVEHRLHIQAPDGHARAFADLELDDQYRPGAYELRIDAAGRGFQLVTREDAFVQQGVLGEPIGASLGFRWSPPRGSLEPGAVVPFSVLAPREAAGTLSAELRATSHGSFLSLGLSGREPQEIADVLNSLMEELVTVAAELRGRKIDETLTSLNGQLDGVEQALMGAERDLEAFRARGAGGWLDEVRLERRLRASEDLYSQVLQRVEAARLARASATPDIRILDRATVPDRPSEDPRIPVTVAVLLGWLAVVAGGALLVVGPDVRPAPSGHGGRAALRRRLDQDVGPALIIVGAAAVATLLTMLLGS